MQKAVVSDKSVQAWDLPTRLFHWSLVTLIVSAYVTSEFAEALGDHLLYWHRCNGVSILTLLVFRLLWGFFGSTTARFSTFFSSPLSALSYIGNLVKAQSKSYLGHNPLGAWMVIGLLTVVATQAGLGLFSSDDTGAAAGPLYWLASSDTVETLTSLHRRVFKLVLLPLIGLHIFANTAYMLIKHEPLIQAMVTGRKPAEAYVDVAETRAPPHLALRALACLAGAIIITLGSLWIISGHFV